MMAASWSDARDGCSFFRDPSVGGHGGHDWALALAGALRARGRGGRGTPTDPQRASRVPLAAAVEAAHTSHISLLQVRRSIAFDRWLEEKKTHTSKETGASHADFAGDNQDKQAEIDFAFQDWLRRKRKTAGKKKTTTSSSEQVCCN
ncbi:unnamed protein product [Phytophthora fragariaefolia]|uniref:Unnamed protein product n=1 Tax=Phytophthora fragariaefolia TaxID=1490495 RepID=A0A9W6XMJ7_9STRA|nr:unnamed protein product [Phytophthora fragariaefolia]